MLTNDCKDEITKRNQSLQNYCNGNNILFVDNSNIGSDCLNNSKLHLNKTGNSIFANNIIKALHDFY